MSAVANRIRARCSTWGLDRLVLVAVLVGAVLGTAAADALADSATKFFTVHSGSECAAPPAVSKEPA